MTNTYKRVSAALLSVLLLCMFTFSASAASSLNVGIKFWKERSDKESMANTGIDASRDVTLTRQSNGTYTLTLPIQQVSKMGALTVTCNIQMDLSVLGEINTAARMCIWNK